MQRSCLATLYPTTRNCNFQDLANLESAALPLSYSCDQGSRITSLLNCYYGQRPRGLWSAPPGSPLPLCVCSQPDRGHLQPMPHKHQVTTPAFSHHLKNLPETFDRVRVVLVKQQFTQRKQHTYQLTRREELTFKCIASSNFTEINEAGFKSCRHTGGRTGFRHLTSSDSTRHL